MANNINNVVASNFDDEKYNNLTATNDVNMNDIASSYNNVNTAMKVNNGNHPSIQDQIIQTANGTNNAEKLIMFDGCSMTNGAAYDNEHCFMENESTIDYKYQSQNEWCNAKGDKLMLNRFDKQNNQTIESNTINDRPLENRMDGPPLDSLNQPLCAQYGCGRNDKCTPQCKQMNCMNCHC